MGENIQYYSLVSLGATLQEPVTLEAQCEHFLAEWHAYYVITLRGGTSLRSEEIYKLIAACDVVLELQQTREEMQEKCQLFTKEVRTLNKYAKTILDMKFPLLPRDTLETQWRRRSLILAQLELQTERAATICPQPK